MSPRAKRRGFGGPTPAAAHGVVEEDQDEDDGGEDPGGTGAFISLVPIGEALRAATVCQAWKDAVAAGVQGLLVLPVARQHVLKPDVFKPNRKEREDAALKSFSAHMEAGTFIRYIVVYGAPILVGTPRPLVHWAKATAAPGVPKIINSRSTTYGVPKIFRPGTAT